MTCFFDIPSHGPIYLIRSLGSFAEIIPQSVCTRHGLYVGAKMVGFVRILLWTLVRLFYCVGDLARVVQCESVGDYCVAYREDPRIYAWATSWHHLPPRWYDISPLPLLAVMTTL